jgi:hypothetical protein
MRVAREERLHPCGQIAPFCQNYPVTQEAKKEVGPPKRGSGGGRPTGHHGTRYWLTRGNHSQIILPAEPLGQLPIASAREAPCAPQRWHPATEPALWESPRNESVPAGAHPEKPLPNHPRTKSWPESPYARSLKKSSRSLQPSFLSNFHSIAHPMRAEYFNRCFGSHLPDPPR